MKKTLALLLAIVMIFALAAPVMADTTTATTGSITIENAVPGQTYKLYRMFDLESYNTATNSYSYITNDNWERFLDGNSPLTYYIDHSDTYADGTTYVSLVEGATAEEIAKAAKECIDNELYNDGNPPQPDYTMTATSTTVVFKDIPLGYYLIDSSVGSLCILNTTNPNAVVKEKNDVPTIDKVVKDGDSWEKENSVSIGDTVEFKTTVNVAKGAENYEIHDRMDSGLTFNKDSVKVYFTLKGSSDKIQLDSSYYTLKTENTCTAFGSGQGKVEPCTFEIIFNSKFYTINGLVDNGGELEVLYSAVLNDNVKPYTIEKNKTMLKYGDDSWTKVSETDTVTYVFNILKYTLNSDNEKVALGGAEFYLTREKNGSIEYAIFEVSEGMTYTDPVNYPDDEPMPFRTYTLEGWTTDISKATKLVSLDKVTMTPEMAGLGPNKPLFYAYANIHVIGIGDGQYSLIESKAPDGYNRVKDPIKFTVNNGLISYAEKTDIDTETEAIEVLNNTGAELPSTGGIGTTIFYIVGGLLMVGAAVVLVTRKKVSADK